MNALIQLERGISGDMQDLLGINIYASTRWVGKSITATALWLILSELKNEQRSYFYFLEAKSVDIDASENTIKSYSQDLDKYIDWLAPSKIQILDVQLQHIEQYLVHLKI